MSMYSCEVAFNLRAPRRVLAMSWISQDKLQVVLRNKRPQIRVAEHSRDFLSCYRSDMYRPRPEDHMLPKSLWPGKENAGNCSSSFHPDMSPALPSTSCWPKQVVWPHLLSKLQSHHMPTAYRRMSVNTPDKGHGQFVSKGFEETSSMTGLLRLHPYKRGLWFHLPPSLKWEW